MIKRFIRFLRNDYRRVSSTIHDMFKFKIPEWVVLIWYIIMAPIGLVLYPFVKIWSKIYFSRMIRKIEKTFK